MNWREKTWVQSQDPKCKTLKSQLEQGVGSGAAWEYFILGDRIICLCYVPVYPNQPLQNKTASSSGNDNVLVHLVYHLQWWESSCTEHRRNYIIQLPVLISPKQLEILWTASFVCFFLLLSFRQSGTFSFNSKRIRQHLWVVSVEHKMSHSVLLKIVKSWRETISNSFCYVCLHFLVLL